MSEDYETKRTEPHGPAQDAAGERPALDDPLLELARIVHNNKQSGANVTSGRVGNTDYFAGLDDVALDSDATSGTASARVEPSFGAAQPAADNQNNDAIIPGLSPVELRPSPEFQTPSVTPGLGTPETITSEQAPIRNDFPELRATAAPAVEPAPAPQQAPAANLGLDREAVTRPESGAESQLKSGFSLDLEQNLTAELEDELIGALRQTVHETPETAAQTELQQAARQFGSETRDEPVTDPPVSGLASVAPAAATPEAERTVSEFPSFNEFGTTAETAAETSRVQPDVPTLDTQTNQFANPVSEPPLRQERVRPAIDEDDLLAALGSDQLDTSAPLEAAPAEPGEEAAGIDALFADLDFPDPVDRNGDQAADEPVAVEDPASANDIDDMTWPAAADAVPHTSEEETAPPPEGYDLDAVARAMQESDPSLNGAGVLPPHSETEQKAVPHSASKSRRGLMVAAGVVGIAAIGAAGFFLIDGNAVQVPSGPPPVISGLQAPLKVYPDGTQTASTEQPGKLIYDRVDGTNETTPDRLIVPDNPQPADLPPAPAGSTGNADLVPGATKRVSTYIVRADGTIVSESNPAPASATPSATVPTNPVAAPVPTAPVSAPEPAVSSPSGGSETPRVVSTTPATTDGAVQPAAPVASTPSNAPTTPPGAVASAPAIVAGPDATTPVTTTDAPVQPPAEGTVSEVVPETPAEIVSVQPRKKPAAPVQVASAPATTTPEPARQADGPLNLTQPAAAPSAPSQPAPTTNSGNIPAGTYIVQVTSQRSAAAATGAYQGLQRQFPSILGNRDAVIVSADLGDRGVFYRARLPMGSRTEAISLCESLKSAGGDCFVRRSP